MEAHSGRMVPVASRIQKLNALAAAMKWPVICDGSCRFFEARLHGALDLWLDVAAGSVPLRRDMTVRLLRPFVPHLSIYERVRLADGGYRYRVRLMGSVAAHFTREMSGHYLDEAVPAAYLPRWNKVFDTVLDECAPVRVLNRGDSFNKNYVVGESFTAPLLNDAGQASLLMAVTFFEGDVPWSKVLAAVRQQLGSEWLPQNVHSSLSSSRS